MRKVGVCMVVNNFDVGGLEKVVLSLLANLDRDAFDLSVVCLDGEGKLFADVGLPPESRLVLNKKPRIKLPGFKVDPVAIAALRRFARERRVDVFHAHNLAPLLYAGIAARLLRPRPAVLYSEHNQIYRADALGKLKFRAYARLADEIGAVSRDLETYLRERLGIRVPMRVLYNGIDGARYKLVDGAATRRALGVADDEFLIGTGVVISEQKGIPFLLEAAKRVCAEDASVRFVVAGEGPLRPSLEEKARAYGLGGRFRFLGYRRDIPELISAFDCYVLPSLWEGLPLALLEALAIGKPIVATRVGGNPEIVEDGRNGFVVPPRDPAALAEALLKVRRDGELREAVATRNPAKFNATFSLRSMIDGHEAVYKRLATNTEKDSLI